MCGRFALTETDRDLVAADLASLVALAGYGLRYNIAGLQCRFVITTDGSLPWDTRPCGTVAAERYRLPDAS